MKKKGCPAFLILSVLLVFAWTAAAQDIVPLKIKKMPRPRPPEIGVCAPSGVATILVTFDKSGKVTTRDVAGSSGCEAFDKNARSAAKDIRFEPKKENGQKVTVSEKIQFRYVIR